MTSAIEHLRPISIEELDRRAALLRRTDTKYVLEREELARLVEDQGYNVLEIDGRRAFSYQSVYFDTPDLRCFRDHVEGLVPRFKARTRCYLDTDQCMFEVKLKVGERETEKHQIEYPPDERVRLDEGANECLRDALGDSAPDDLRISLRTRFERVTLVPADGRERLTSDFGICLERPGNGLARLRDGLVVFEVKGEDDAGPTNELMAAQGIESISLSKYRTGIALLAPDADDPESPTEAEQQFEVAIAL